MPPRPQQDACLDGQDPYRSFLKKASPRRSSVSKRRSLRSRHSAKTPPKGAAALGDLVRMCTKRAIWGRRTVCRARQSSNAADTLPGTWLSSVKRLSFRLEEASGGILSAVRELPDEVRARAPFEAWLSPLAVRGSQSSSLFEAVMLPLGSQQSASRRNDEAQDPSQDGHMISLSYAQATSVLKTSPDNRFRRSVFALFNAWFAEHGCLCRPAQCGARLEASRGACRGTGLHDGGVRGRPHHARSAARHDEGA